MPDRLPHEKRLVVVTPEEGRPGRRQALHHEQALVTEVMRHRAHVRNELRAQIALQQVNPVQQEPVLGFEVIIAEPEPDTASAAPAALSTDC